MSTVKANSPERCINTPLAVGFANSKIRSRAEPFHNRPGFRFVYPFIFAALISEVNLVLVGTNELFPS